MKKIIKMMILFITLNSFAQHGQFSLSLGIDPKIAIMGTSNDFTTHDARVNYQVKIEYLDDGLYFAVGTEYVNLNSHYESWILNIGKPFTIKISEDYNIFNTIKIIPSIEIGEIFRELQPVRGYERNDSQDHYLGMNIGVRYQLKKWCSIEAEGNIDFAKDLPDRLLRYGGKINLIIHLFKS